MTEINEPELVEIFTSVTLTCDACSFTFSKFALLADHLKFHDADSFHTKIVYSCDFCGQKDMTFGNAIFHFSTAHPEWSKEEDYNKAEEGGVKKTRRRLKPTECKTCPTCQKEFRRPADLQRHLLVHTGERPFECEVCLERFKLKNHYLRHVVTHNTRKKPSYQCAVCKKFYFSSTALRLHLRLHTNVTPFSCEDPACSKAFRTKKLMLTHFKAEHVAKAPKERLCEAAKSQLFEIVRTARQRPPSQRRLSTGDSDRYQSEMVQPVAIVPSYNSAFTVVQGTSLNWSKNSAFSAVKPTHVPVANYGNPPISTGNVLIRIHYRAHSSGPPRYDMCFPVEDLRLFASKNYVIPQPFKLRKFSAHVTFHMLIHARSFLDELQRSEVGFCFGGPPQVGDPTRFPMQSTVVIVVTPADAALAPLPYIFVECFVSCPEATAENRQQYAQSCHPVSNSGYSNFGRYPRIPENFSSNAPPRFTQEF